MPARLFISYAREDEKTAEALADHLDQLEALGIAETWIDRDIELGTSWEQTIATQADGADVVLLLVSHSYLASGFAHDRELKLIEQAYDRGARVVPIIVGDCEWQAHPFIGSLQAFARGKRLERPATVTFQRQAAELVGALRHLLSDQPEQETSVPATTRAAPQDTAQKAPAARLDQAGLAYKGSQLQTQLYVNAHPDELSRACLDGVEALPRDAVVEWRSPLREHGYAEYHDAEFLKALGLQDLTDSLAEFWPSRGPRWDALAVVRSATLDRPGVILAEGKSYPEEMRSTTRAKGRSRQKIERAIAATQASLGVDPDPERWMAGYYQLANRLAHLVWLREAGVEAWLIQLLFVDDPHRKTTAQEWGRAIADVRLELGLEAMPFVGDVPLAALDRSLLES